MQPCRRFSLEPLSESRARLMDSITGAALEVDGVVLETQLELAPGLTVVMLTDDCPYEEGLHVYLMGTTGELLDALEAGAMYSPGILRVLEASSEHIDLTFFGNGQQYRLSVAPHPMWRAPLPRGWRYKRFWRRHRLGVEFIAQQRNMNPR